MYCLFMWLRWARPASGAQAGFAREENAADAGWMQTASGKSLNEEGSGSTGNEGPVRSSTPPPSGDLKLSSGIIARLAQKESFSRVAAWMEARKAHGGSVPPLSPYHPLNSPFLFPTLTVKPFHDDRSLHHPRLAEQVKLLEHLAPIVQAEVVALRHKTGFQPFRGRSTDRPAAADGIGHLTHDAGDWSVFYLMAGSVDCSAQQKLCPKTSRLLRGLPCHSSSAFFSVLTPGTHICGKPSPTTAWLLLRGELHGTCTLALRIHIIL